MLQNHNKCEGYFSALRKELDCVSAVYCLDELNESEKNEVLKVYAGVTTKKLPQFPTKEVLRQGGFDFIKEAMRMYLDLELVKDGSSLNIIPPWSSYPLATYHNLDEVLDPVYITMIDFGIWRVDGHGKEIPESILQEHFKSLDDIFYFLEEFWVEAGVRFYLNGVEFPAIRISKTCLH